MTHPPFTEKDAIQIASEYYGIDAEAKSLPGDIDKNFLITSKPDRSLRPVRFVLKIHSPETPREEIEFQNAALRHLKDFEGTPHIIPNKDGDELFVYDKKYLVPENIYIRLERNRNYE